MYERFTDRARKVMQLANLEAQRLKVEYVGTEHILLGIIKEGTGIAVAILKTFRVDLPKMAQQVESMIPSSPDRKTKTKPPQTPRAKKVIEYAMDELCSLQPDSKSVGTEYLLLGLLREREGIAGQVLMNFGLHLEAVRGEIAKRTVQEPMTDSQGSQSPDSAPRSAARALGQLIRRVARALGFAR
jgi:ATP-dependent Clp protease ATP-binding subunit ClpC